MEAMTNAEKLIKLYNTITECEDCPLQETAWLHAVDWSIVPYVDQTSIPFLIVGQAPAYCEDRVGLPLVGAKELLTWRCGWCTNLKECFSYFLHQTTEYKHHNTPCKYAKADGPDTIKEESYAPRMIGVQRDMRQKGETFDPTTAGEILDWMLALAGMWRGSHVQLRLDEAYYRDQTEVCQVLPDTAVINTVQCRSCKVENGIVQNRPPSDEERQACFPHVASLVDLLRPKVIIALGLEAVKSMTGREIDTMKSVLSQRMTYIEDPSIPVFAFYHPSYYLHQLSMCRPQDRAAIQESIKKDAERLKQIADTFRGE